MKSTAIRDAINHARSHGLGRVVAIRVETEREAAIVGDALAHLARATVGAPPPPPPAPRVSRFEDTPGNIFDLAVSPLTDPERYEREERERKVREAAEARHRREVARLDRRMAEVYASPIQNDIQGEFLAWLKDSRDLTYQEFCAEREAQFEESLWDSRDDWECP